MEENNNDERNIVDKGKETAKNEAKKAGKNIAKKAIKWAWPAISIFLIILLAFGVLNLVVYTIQSFFSSLLSIFNPDQEASSSSTNQTQSIISIDEDGAYTFNKNYGELIAEELEKQKIDTESLGFSIDEFGDMIEKYIKTEVQTMFPKIGSYAKDGLDGTIIVKRASTDGNTYDLTYKPYEEFKKTGTVNEFSINPKDFKLCLYVTERY